MIKGSIVLISLLVAFLRGGRLQGEIPGLIYPVLAFAVQTLLGRLFPGTTIGAVANLAGFVVALPFVWLNRRSIGLTCLLAGMALNFAVMSANGGRMPADIDLFIAVGGTVPVEELPKHQPLTPETNMPLLADVIPIPLWPQPILVSIGDLAAWCGLFLFIQELMGRPLLRWPGAPQPR